MRQAARRSQSRIVWPVSPLYERIYAMVKRIPPGKVATYGQIAKLVGRCGPRQVGYAMSAVKDDDVPWQRVINAKGEVSERWDADHQRVRLREEGVEFDERGRVDLNVYRWQPD